MKVAHTKEASSLPKQAQHVTVNIDAGNATSHTVVLAASCCPLVGMFGMYDCVVRLPTDHIWAVFAI